MYVESKKIYYWFHANKWFAAFAGFGYIHIAFVQRKLLCTGFKDLICHQAYLSVHDPNSTGHLKSTGRHTDTVDGTELKMAET